MSLAIVRDSTATSAVDDPEMPAKNMLNSVTTCASPPRRWPTSVCDRWIIRCATSEDAISSPTSRKNGTASSVSESMPWKSWPTIDCMLICVNPVATSTPATNANDTGTPM